jgi:hypothetical protein
MSERHSLSLAQPITISLSKLHLLQRMASNDNNGKYKLEEEAEYSIARKRLWLSNDDDGDDDDSSDSPEEETEEEVSLEEMLMNQRDTPSTSLEPRTPESRRRFDEESNDEDDNNFWM